MSTLEEVVLILMLLGSGLIGSIGMPVPAAILGGAVFVYLVLYFVVHRVKINPAVSTGSHFSHLRCLGIWVLIVIGLVEVVEKSWERDFCVAVCYLSLVLFARAVLFVVARRYSRSLSLLFFCLAVAWLLLGVTWEGKFVANVISLVCLVFSVIVLFRTRALQSAPDYLRVPAVENN